MTWWPTSQKQLQVNLLQEPSSRYIEVSVYTVVLAELLSTSAHTVLMLESKKSHSFA